MKKMKIVGDVTWVIEMGKMSGFAPIGMKFLAEDADGTRYDVIIENGDMRMTQIDDGQIYDGDGNG